ncbi:hypothetical protein GZH49_12145 [Nocardia terpenica]|uniref:hypothetical protein n=1 Tax=Nocardia terpenica TaxID=455432 RepID=UPI002FE408BF
MTGHSAHPDRLSGHDDEDVECWAHFLCGPAQRPLIAAGEELAAAGYLIPGWPHRACDWPHAPAPADPDRAWQLIVYEPVDTTLLARGYDVRTICDTHAVTYSGGGFLIDLPDPHPPCAATDLDADHP